MGNIAEIVEKSRLKLKWEPHYRRNENGDLVAVRYVADLGPGIGRMIVYPEDDNGLSEECACENWLHWSFRFESRMERRKHGARIDACDDAEARLYDFCATVGDIFVGHECDCEQLEPEPVGCAYFDDYRTPEMTERARRVVTECLPRVATLVNGIPQEGPAALAKAIQLEITGSLQVRVSAEQKKETVTLLLALSRIRPAYQAMASVTVDNGLKSCSDAVERNRLSVIREELETIRREYDEGGGDGDLDDDVDEGEQPAPGASCKVEPLPVGGADDAALAQRLQDGIPVSSAENKIALALEAKQRAYDFRLGKGWTAELGDKQTAKLAEEIADLQRRLAKAQGGDK